MAKAPKSPIPTNMDQVTYWLVAAVAGAIVGGLVYSFLSRNDPI